MKIICVGKNYAEHIKELSGETPEEPVLFMKPDTSLLKNEQDFYLPEFSENLHYEVEIVIKISKAGKHIQPEFAHRYYEEITAGLDLTARDIQNKLKAKGLPWEKSKAFDNSAVVGKFLSKHGFDLTCLNFSLKKNEEIVQNGNTKDMLFPIDFVIAEASKYFTLKVGDLIFTGTPEGVGKLKENDFLEGFVGEQKVFELKIN